MRVDLAGLAGRRLAWTIVVDREWGGAEPLNVGLAAASTLEGVRIFLLAQITVALAWLSTGCEGEGGAAFCSR